MSPQRLALKDAFFSILLQETFSEGIADERQHAAPVENAQPRSERHGAGDFRGARRVVTRTEVHGARADARLEEHRVEPGEDETEHLRPPGDVAHVLVRSADE